MASCDTYHW